MSNCHGNNGDISSFVSLSINLEIIFLKSNYICNTKIIYESLQTMCWRKSQIESHLIWFQGRQINGMQQIYICLQFDTIPNVTIFIPLLVTIRIIICWKCFLTTWPLREHYPSSKCVPGFRPFESDNRLQGSDVAPVGSHCLMGSPRTFKQLLTLHGKIFQARAT